MLKSMRVQGRPCTQVAEQQFRDLQVVQQQERQRVVAVEHRVLAPRDDPQPLRCAPRLAHDAPQLVVEPVGRTVGGVRPQRVTTALVEVGRGQRREVLEGGDGRMRARVALDGEHLAVRGLDEVEADLAGDREAGDELAHPRLDGRLVDALVVDLEGRGRAADVDEHAAVAGGGVRAPFAAGHERLQDPRVVRRDRFGRGKAGRLGDARPRQRGQIEPVDRVVGDVLEHVGPAVAGEVEPWDGGGLGDQVGVRHPEAEVGSGGGEAVLVVEQLDEVGVGVQHLAVPGEGPGRDRVVARGERAAHRHVEVDLLGPHDRQQRLRVPRIGRLRHDVEGVDRAREPMTGEPVLLGLDEHDAVTGGRERPAQVQRLGHLAAADEHGASRRRRHRARSGGGAALRARSGRG